MELNPCAECGVPEMAASEHLWLNNGDIVHSRARTSRMVFMETEHLDPLFRGMEEIIGVRIEHMVITAGRRPYRTYLKAFIPKKVREMIKNKELDYEVVDAAFRDVARFNGSGSYDRVELRYKQDENDFDTVSITEPYSVLMCVSAHIGAIELLSGFDQGYRYEHVSPDVIHITSFPSQHPEELKDRMWFKPYEHQEGDLELERCATCGCPKALSDYQWYLERGVIANKNHGRRMAIQGDALLDPIFFELEKELGDAIPRAVVEAERVFTKSGLYTKDDITGEEDFRIQLALRGLGNLRELTMKKEGMRMCLENVVLPLMIVGLTQGLFEIAFSIDSSSVDWEVSPEGNLVMEVKPK